VCENIIVVPAAAVLISKYVNILSFDSICVFLETINCLSTLKSNTYINIYIYGSFYLI